MLRCTDLIEQLKSEGFCVGNALTGELRLGEQLQPVDPVNDSLLALPFTRGIPIMQECQLCAKKFGQEIALRKHLRTNHSDSALNFLNKMNAPNDQENLDTHGAASTSTHYEIYDSDFVITEKGENDSKDETFYVVFRIEKSETTHRNVYNRDRKARRPESKPRKPYGSTDQYKKRSDSSNVLTGPFNCVQCEGVYETCCLYSKHFHKAHSNRKSTAHRCQICEKKFGFV